MPESDLEKCQGEVGQQEESMVVLSKIGRKTLYTNVALRSRQFLYFPALGTMGAGSTNRVSRVLPQPKLLSPDHMHIHYFP